MLIEMTVSVITQEDASCLSLFGTGDKHSMNVQAFVAYVKLMYK